MPADRAGASTSAAVDRLTRADFQAILADIRAFWPNGAPPVFHPMFLEEFGDTAFVVRDGEQVAAHLFGLIAATSPTGYIHLVAVREGYRGRGLASLLYAHFAEVARARGCTRLKAITSPGNAASIGFHRRMGFTLLGDPDDNGVPVVRDYSGPGVDRVVMVRPL
jgi:GNAT superfamily N-acetyltransferase